MPPVSQCRISRGQNSRERGFLLVEALVALAIVALMATLVFDSVWQMGKTSVVASEKREALLLAQSVLAAACVPGLGAPIAPRGTDGPFAWQLSDEPSAQSKEGGVRLATVAVTITDSASGRVLARIETLRAGQ